MNTIVETINTAGRDFVAFAMPMLIQSGLLILILLAVDLLLRRRVRAVFRYWIWLLVLVKLVLPPSLGSPVSIGAWLGDRLEVPTAKLLAPAEQPQASTPATPEYLPSPPPGISLAKPPKPANELAPQTRPPVQAAPLQRDEPVPDASVPPLQKGERPAASGVALTWQGLVLLLWAAVVTALLLLLAQRAVFVRGLLVQAKDADRQMLDILAECRAELELKGPVALKISSNGSSPAVCGLLRPTVLIPQAIAPGLAASDLKVVLLHELAHVKRGDLWINLFQTLLQIAYFYNPLLWPANAMIRRTREQAVDEAVLVAMGERARQYPETLLTIAKLAFRRRPALSLRLIGVVESKSALTGRIKHILSRPMPRTAKVGVAGLATVALIAFILLPMAKARPMTEPARTVMVLAEEEARTLRHDYIGTEHILLALARQEDAVSTKVLWSLGLGVTELRSEVDTLVQRGAEPVNTAPLARTPRAARVMTHAREEAKALGHDYIGTEHILLGLMREEQAVAARVLRRMDLTGQQLHDETLRFVQPANRPSNEPSVRAAEDWTEESQLALRRALMRDRMPLPELVAHTYYEVGEPIWISVPVHDGKGWRPRLDEIYADGETRPMFFVIDGKEYDSRHGFGPFGGAGMKLTLPSALYVDDFQLAVGRHTVSYGWRDLDVVDPNDPDNPVRYDRVVTDPVEFEVVEEVPKDYYRPIYKEGWDEALRRSIETPFTDEMRGYGITGPLLALAIRADDLPFATAFAVFIQSEGSDERYPAGELALEAGQHRFIMGCDHDVEELDWDTVGDRRWRIILRPSMEVARRHPPIREFYAREFVTDWLTFELSPQFEQHKAQAQRERPAHYGGTIKADKPVDLDRLSGRWGGQGEAWPLPEGFELGWSRADSGTLRIDPDSGVRLLWLPDANARLTDVRPETRQRLSALPQSRTTEVVPPEDERTLIAVLSSEGRVYWVRVSKVDETWANLSWCEDEDSPMGPMPRRLTLSGAEERRIRKLAKLAGASEAQWEEAARELREIGPKVAGPLSEMFRKGGPEDVRVLDVLTPIATSEHVQAVMRENLELDPQRYPNTIHCSLIVLGRSGNRVHVPRIARLLKENVGSGMSPIAAVSALKQLGGDEAFAAVRDLFVQDVPSNVIVLASQALIGVDDPKAIPYLEQVSDALDATGEEAGPKRTINECIYRLTGGDLNSTSVFTMPVFDRNVPHFDTYIGGNLARFDTDYVDLSRYDLEVGVAPEALFQKQGESAFYMRAGHEFVPLRGTIIAPLALPEVEPNGNRGWLDRLKRLYPSQILEQVGTYRAEHPDADTLRLEDRGLYVVITPERTLLVMQAKFGRYETGAEATSMTCVRLAEDVADPMAASPESTQSSRVAARAALQKDPTRASFPDLTIRVSYPGADGAKEYGQARSIVDDARGSPSEAKLMEAHDEFEALSGRRDAFPTSLYAKRWLIITDWLLGQIDGTESARRMEALAEAQTDDSQRNFTRAYAATILARDGHIVQAQDLLLDCPPTMTPQWGWFVFEMNKYFERHVESCAPNVDRVVNGRIVQEARTPQEWQATERELAAAQTTYADYIEYDLLPRAVEAIAGNDDRHYALIERVQVVDALRHLLVGHTDCFSLGASTDAIQDRFRRRVAPKVLAAWHQSLQLFDDERLAKDTEGHLREIRTRCEGLGLPSDSLSSWWQRILSDTEHEVSEMTTADRGAGGGVPVESSQPTGSPEIEGHAGTSNGAMLSLRIAPKRRDLTDATVER